MPGCTRAQGPIPSSPKYRQIPEFQQGWARPGATSSKAGSRPPRVGVCFCLFSSSSHLKRKPPFSSSDWWLAFHHFPSPPTPTANRIVEPRLGICFWPFSKTPPPRKAKPKVPADSGVPTRLSACITKIHEFKGGCWRYKLIASLQVTKSTMQRYNSEGWTLVGVAPTLKFTKSTVQTYKQFKGGSWGCKLIVSLNLPKSTTQTYNNVIIRWTLLALKTI